VRQLAVGPSAEQLGRKSSGSAADQSAADTSAGPSLADSAYIASGATSSVEGPPCGHGFPGNVRRDEDHHQPSGSRLVLERLVVWPHERVGAFPVFLPDQQQDPPASVLAILASMLREAERDW
jgi:hypothetical protein